jgi:hypothetical protein
VHVVDHQPEPVFQCRQVLQQAFHDRPPVQIGRRGQLPHQPRPGRRLAQRPEHRQPEPLRITLATRHRHPRGPLRESRLADPGPQQDRLPAPRRRRHHCHPRRPEPPEQPRTSNNPTRTRASGSAGPGPRSLRSPHDPSSHDASARSEPPAAHVRCHLPQLGLPDPHRSRHRPLAQAHRAGIGSAGRRAPRPGGYSPRSQCPGAMSSRACAGPHEPGAYPRTGAGWSAAVRPPATPRPTRLAG